MDYHIQSFFDNPIIWFLHMIRSNFSTYMGMIWFLLVLIKFQGSVDSVPTWIHIKTYNIPILYYPWPHLLVTNQDRYKLGMVEVVTCKLAPNLYYLFKFHMDQNHWFFILKYPNSIFNPWSGNNCFRNRLDNTFSPNLKSGLLSGFDLKSAWVCRSRFHIAINRPVYVSYYPDFIPILSIFYPDKIKIKSR